MIVWGLRAIVTAVILVLLTASSVLATPEVLWRREGWDKTDFSKRAIEWHEIMSGGLPKDGIPAIDSPRFIAVPAASSIGDDEAVIGVEINGDVRAYPLRVMMWHDIVNDTIGGVPVAVTYCPLCNAAIVFERNTPQGILDFGTSGKLRNSDLVMYDRQTESWWQQYSGKAIVGQLVGAKLRLVPARLEGFALFRERHPAGRVLVPSDPSLRQYGRNPYEGYDTSAVPFLFRGEFRAGIEPMTRVVVVRDGEAAAAVTLKLIREKGPISVGGTVLTWRKGQASALDASTVAGGRDVGNVIAQKRLADGHLFDVAYDVTFAFVFHAFHPGSDIIESCDGSGRRYAADHSIAAGCGS